MGTKWAKRMGVEITRTQTGNSTGRMSHEARLEFIDNSQKVLAQLNNNGDRALNAVGVKAVGMIVNQMEHGYAKRIRQTGDLQRDVSYLVHSAEKKVDVGNTLEYGPPVHEGTRKMEGRPYMRDALLNGKNQTEIKETYNQYLKQGFGK